MSFVNDITVTAYIKSIIESGADPKDWENRLRTALALHEKVCNAYHQKEQKSRKSNTRSS